MWAAVLIDIIIIIIIFIIIGIMILMMMIIIIINKKVSFNLEQAMKSYRGVEAYFYSFFDVGTGWAWVVKATPRPLCLREKESVSIQQEDGWVPGAV
jgi:hypothetical protein